MSTSNRAQILEILSGSDLHAQGVAIRLFFQRARLFARRISALSWFPCHCYLQSKLLIRPKNISLPLQPSTAARAVFCGFLETVTDCRGNRRADRTLGAG